MLSHEMREKILSAHMLLPLLFTYLGAPLRTSPIGPPGSMTRKRCRSDPVRKQSLKYVGIQPRTEFIA
eukprot:4658098-Amphidinium_carterae.1